MQVLASTALLVPTGAVPLVPGYRSGNREYRTQAGGWTERQLRGPERERRAGTAANRRQPYADTEGVGDDSRTTRSHVFTATHTGDRHTKVWLTDEAADVRFYHGRDSADSFEGRANSVVLRYGLSVADEEDGVRANLRATTGQAGHFELAVAGTGLFLALPFATFPVDPVVDGRVLNLYVHLLGYALGFIASYVLVVVESGSA